MDDGTPYCPRPKHLPQLVPKIDESNCPTATEIARIESVKPCDAEGMLIRRKWKKKVRYLSSDKRRSSLERITELTHEEWAADIEEKMRTRYLKEIDTNLCFLDECLNFLDGRDKGPWRRPGDLSAVLMYLQWRILDVIIISL